MGCRDRTGGTVATWIIRLRETDCIGFINTVYKSSLCECTFDKFIYLYVSKPMYLRPQKDRISMVGGLPVRRCERTRLGLKSAEGCSYHLEFFSFLKVH